MKTGRKNWFIVASVFISCGLLFVLAGLILVGFNFSKLNTRGEAVHNEYEVKESFSEIKIDTSIADVEFLESKDGKVRVVCDETEKYLHEVKVDGNVLNIRLKDKKSWFDFIGFGFGSKEKIQVYLPKQNAEGEGGSENSFYSLDRLDVHTSTGYANISGLDVKGEFKVDVSTGEIRLSRIKAGTMNLDCSTGSSRLEYVMVSEDLKINTGTGDVTLVKCDAEKVNIDTGTGDITCEFLTSKNIKADTGTGDISLPENRSTGGECKLDSGTGEIKVKYAK